jgi:predicted TIM-barrel fold metal-dependent hydrolase
MTAPDNVTGAPYVVVSVDGHASPSLEHQLRDYCPQRYLEDFDAFVKLLRDTEQATREGRDPRGPDGKEVPSELRTMARFEKMSADPKVPAPLRQAMVTTRNNRGQQDPKARLADMDADGVAAEVIFAGSTNGELLPFLGFGFDAGAQNTDVELKAAGGHIWNSWLADYVAEAPERLHGVIQVPIHDIGRSVEEVRWCAQRGLHILNLPAPRRDFPAYTFPDYEPLWEVCEEYGVTLATHGGGGERSLGEDGPQGSALFYVESQWLSRRGLWQLIFGGVFERHPGLQLVFTEQRVDWVPHTIRNLDSVYLSERAGELRAALPRLPSEYWARNCFIGGSHLAAYEVAVRDQVGLSNLLWGTDYPHIEGTWPYTRLAMRNTFAGVPEADVRKIIGENALPVYHLDAGALRAIADKIGPAPADLAVPLSPQEFPEHRGFAFRELGDMY